MCILVFTGRRASSLQSDRKIVPTKKAEVSQSSINTLKLPPSILINGLSDLSAGNHDNKRNFIRIRTYDPSRVAGLYSIPEKIL
ncbi:hypothetical protein KEM48_013194 [Puccinia striiformis f. sp. tritici PST-130]|nr:hypothetical protein KEM48_013194 [Puccinia striiformis f. sp. tritici PST-130]